YQQFCRNKYLISACIVSCSTLLLMPSIASQLGCLALAALSGGLLHKRLDKQLGGNPIQSSDYARVRWRYLSIFILLMLLTWLPMQPWLATFSHFYQAGSWVFGGGHVVLPLLQQSLVQQLPAEQLISAYAAAQAVPGPMFTIASFLGAVMTIESPIIGAALATIAIFLPGLLLVLAFVDVWQTIAQQAKFAAAIQMLNAAVVGLLLAAMYQPIFTTAVNTNLDAVCALFGLFLLRVLKLSVLWVLLSLALAGLLWLG
uniref:chromate transporter n=1 Tax=Agarivorans sp. TaxID=1872412 RepID=UPI003D002FE5